MHALVNKFIRDKITKEENRVSRNDATDNYAPPAQPFEIEDDATLLLNKDEHHERAMVRSLIEFGLKTWEEEQRVAEYIFAEIETNQLEELIDNKSLIALIQTYKNMYDEGLEPNAKTFLYHEDEALSKLVILVMDYNHEISPNWKNIFEGKIFTREDLYKEEVFSTLNYLKLRKIKRMMDENQRNLEKEHTSEEQMVLLQIHQHLKQVEIELVKELGTVIFR